MRIGSSIQLFTAKKMRIRDIYQVKFKFADFKVYNEGEGARCTPPPLWFFAFTLKIFRQSIPENSLLLQTLYCECPYGRVLSGHPVQKYFTFFFFKLRMYEIFLI